MKRDVLRLMCGGLLVVGMTACEALRGPDRKGEIQLSSQLFGADSYYLFGFHFEDADYYRYRFQGDPVPDIINDGMRILQGGEVVVLPQFTVPIEGTVLDKIGFAKIGEFGNLEDARSFYESYGSVGNDLQFELNSDTVELYQVYVQKTIAGNYAKLLVTNIRFDQSESGNKFNEVVMEYTYQPNGSATFPE